MAESRGLVNDIIGGAAETLRVDRCEIWISWRVSGREILASEDCRDTCFPLMRNDAGGGGGGDGDGDGGGGWRERCRWQKHLYISIFIQECVRTPTHPSLVPRSFPYSNPGSTAYQIPFLCHKPKQWVSYFMPR